jgi:hypothetical protein
VKVQERAVQQTFVTLYDQQRFKSIVINTNLQICCILKHVQEKRFIGRNIIQDEKILMDLKKFMVENDDDHDLNNGFHLLGFVADHVCEHHCEMTPIFDFKKWHFL